MTKSEGVSWGGDVESSLADTLDRLLTGFRCPETGAAVSLREFARRCEEVSGESFSHEYLRQLRTGMRTNPTMRHLRAIAHVLGVRVEVFFTPGAVDDVERDWALLHRFREAGVEHIAMRLGALTDVDRARVEQVLDEIEQQRR